MSQIERKGKHLFKRHITVELKNQFETEHFEIPFSMNFKNTTFLSLNSQYKPNYCVSSVFTFCSH